MLQLPNEPGNYANFKKRNESYNKKIESLDKANSLTPLDKNLLETSNIIHSSDLQQAKKINVDNIITNAITGQFATIVQELSELPDYARNMFEWLDNDPKKSLENITNNLKILPNDKIKYNEYSDDPEDILATGVVYLYKGEYNQALEYFYKAIKIAEKTLVPSNKTIADINFFIGKTYLLINEPVEALNYLNKAKNIQELIQPDFSDTAKTYELIGSAYRLIGDKDNALRYLHKAYEIFNKVLGKDHKFTLRVLKMINEIK